MASTEGFILSELDTQTISSPALKRSKPHDNDQYFSSQTSLNNNTNVNNTNYSANNNTNTNTNNSRTITLPSSFNPMSPPFFESPFLLLDVRPREEYLTCHIATAQNYPFLMTIRGANELPPKMHLYKNLPGKMVILYDQDER